MATPTIDVFFTRLFERKDLFDTQAGWARLLEVATPSVNQWARSPSVVPTAKSLLKLRAHFALTLSLDDPIRRDFEALIKVPIDQAVRMVTKQMSRYATLEHYMAVAFKDELDDRLKELTGAEQMVVFKAALSEASEILRKRNSPVNHFARSAKGPVEKETPKSDPLMEDRSEGGGLFSGGGGGSGGMFSRD